MGVNVEKADILKVAEFLGMGYYRVKETGEFLEADPIARELFGIPQDKETDLSQLSLEKLYTFPAERKLRLDKLEKSGGKPISSTLSLRVNREDKLLFDLCWGEGKPGEEKCYAGLVKNIEERVISPKMFDEFPVGIYQLDDNNKIMRYNKKALEIFGYNEKDNLLGRNIADFYADQEELKSFSERVKREGFAQDVLKFKNAESKVIELECFTEHINEFKMARWGLIHDVTKQQRYYKALDKMPTGYYYIDYDEKGKHKHHGRIVQCNDQFAKILGVENKENLIGEEATKYYASVEEGEEYFRRLDKADEAGGALLGYPFRIKRADNGKIVHIATDSHLVREHGKVVGREGTIRDISKQVELEEKVKETEKRLNEITADINNLIHTFLHPVLKFFGNSELFRKLGNILYKSIRHKPPNKGDLLKLGKELEEKLDEIKERLKDISRISEDARILAPIFEKIGNVFDYNLDRAKKSKILLDKATRDVALWVLEELDLIGFFNKNFKKGRLGDVITDEFIEYLEDILFGYLIRTAGILKGETQVMRREVEALRRYLNVGQKKKYSFKKRNLGKILQENIELFTPILAQKDVEIEHQNVGYLIARISQNDIDRVVCNLFHNASKYSENGPGRFVKIRGRDLQQEGAVEFHIKSCGVPIKKHEIESGDIFKFGYRSNLAYRTDRDGTGVGLADAKEVIEAHGGKIVITSESMRDDGYPPEYKVPYITTVTVKLPKSKKRRKSKK